MPRPRLIHPVDVTIQPLDTSSTLYDRDTRAPVPTQARSATVTISAQVHWARLEDVNQEAAGPVPRYDGYLVFLRRDLDAAPYVPGPGDRVVLIEQATVDLFLTGNAQQRGQYGRRHHLVRCYFEDRGARRD